MCDVQHDWCSFREQRNLRHDQIPSGCPCANAVWLSVIPRFFIESGIVGHGNPHAQKEQMRFDASFPCSSILSTSFCVLHRRGAVVEPLNIFPTPSCTALGAGEACNKGLA